MIWMQLALWALALPRLGVAGAHSAISKESKREIETFNRKFIDLILKRDHDGMLAMWADDGVDLMPGEPPMVGKAQIAAWLKGIESASPRARVSKEDVEFHDIQVSADWASEWATEHQVVERPGQAPAEGYGKIALVLRRDRSGEWKIKQEMWNDAPQP